MFINSVVNGRNILALLVFLIGIGVFLFSEFGSAKMIIGIILAASGVATFDFSSRKSE